MTVPGRLFFVAACHSLFSVRRLKKSFLSVVSICVYCGNLIVSNTIDRVNDAASSPKTARLERPFSPINITHWQASAIVAKIVFRSSCITHLERRKFYFKKVSKCDPILVKEQAKLVLFSTPNHCIKKVLYRSD